MRLRQIVGSGGVHPFWYFLPELALLGLNDPVIAFPWEIQAPVGGVFNDIVSQASSCTYHDGADPLRFASGRHIIIASLYT